MQTFNSRNGQIYTETTSSSVRSMVPTWKRHTTGRMIRPTAFKNTAKGSSSLRDTALRSCCWNIHLFMPEALADPGWHYASMIYQYLKANDILTYEAWTLFQQAYPTQLKLNHDFRVSHHDCTTYWSSIVKSLSVLSSNVLTHFCAYGIELNLSHLISLTDIPSLAALIHVHPSQRTFNPLQGTGVRDWCRAVREKNAFQELKLLYMSSIPQDGCPDSAVLGHISSFPALSLVGIERRSPDDPLKPHGQWERPALSQAEELSNVMRGMENSVSEKMNRLYRHAEKISSPKRNIDDSVSLSLSCYSNGSARHIAGISWFVRKHVQPELQPKRSRDIQDSQKESGRTKKKHKIRRGKQQDVGSLLEGFL